MTTNDKRYLQAVRRYKPSTLFGTYWRGAKYQDQRVCVCPSVCSLAYLKNLMSKLHQSFCRRCA